MGCDIHSFVMTLNKQTNTYKPIVGYVSTPFGGAPYWRTIQPYEERYYDFFGFITEGRCRGDDYPIEGVCFNQGRFSPVTVDPSYTTNITNGDQDTCTSLSEINRTAVDYFNTDNHDLHTHGWVSLAQLKRNRKLVKKTYKHLQDKLNKEGDDNDGLLTYRIDYLKGINQALKLMINNTEAMLSFTWEAGMIDDLNVIICFAFDS